MKFSIEEMSGVWSAMPTPFDSDWNLDTPSIFRLVEHQIRLGIKGLFIGGTSGEGPWLSQRMLHKLAVAVARAVNNRIPVAVQITDNSAVRMLDNIKNIADSGIDIVMAAPPFFMENPTQDYIRKCFREVIEKSPLPMGLYHRGRYSSVNIEGKTIAELAADKKVVMIKDSSSDESSSEKFVNLKQSRPDLLLLNGNEFDCISYLLAGCDGLLLGGACFNGGMAKQIFELVKEGKIEQAGTVQTRMNNLMHAVFGGQNCDCWLAGEKQLLVEMGIFSTSKILINYRLTPECATVIKRVVDDYKDELLPCQEKKEKSYAL